ncbi:hypothetical protein JXI42_01725 [bacterium]|nr:hypothetical protein [bacterium]
MRVTLLSLAILLIIYGIVAAVPSQMYFQGRLTDSLGTPIDSTENVIFRIYDDSLGGSALWEEATEVFFNTGLFAVNLGDVNPLPDSIFTGEILYLEMIINGDVLEPRKTLVTVPYAFRADIADSIVGVALNFDTLRAYLDTTFLDTLNAYLDTTFRGNVTHIDSISFIDSISYIDSIHNIDSISYIDSIGWIGHTVWADSAHWAGYIHWDSIDGIPDSVFEGGADNDWTGAGTGQMYTTDTNDSVGIGLTSPSEKLHVNGNVLITGGINDGTGFGTPGQVLKTDGSDAYWNDESCIYVDSCKWHVTDSVLYTNNLWGIARGGAGNALLGDSGHTHVNLGVACTTNSWYSTVGGGEGNIASSVDATVSGGRWNTASGDVSAVGGGDSNTASGGMSTISGGYQNTADGGYATVTGGRDNSADWDYATVCGGTSNTASNSRATVCGGSENTAGAWCAVVSGGNQNTVIGQYSVIPGGSTDTVSGDYSFAFGRHAVVNTDYTARFFSPDYPGSLLVSGYTFIYNDLSVPQIYADWIDPLYGDTVYFSAPIKAPNFPSGDSCNWRVTDSVLYTRRYWGIARGNAGNILHGDSANTHVNLGVACTTGARGIVDYWFATVSGGRYNAATDYFTTVAGGEYNDAIECFSTISGGENNTASGFGSTVSGGSFNTSSSDHTTVGGGSWNEAESPNATIAGGQINIASNSSATIAGGYFNLASGEASTIAGGEHNTASGQASIIAGGEYNSATRRASTIAGGYHNMASGTYSTVGGGEYDTVKALNGGVFSGRRNYAGDALNDTASHVGGGWNNKITVKFSTISGGRNNSITGASSAIGGGYRNSATGIYSTISGGYFNTAGNGSATVSGGSQNNSNGQYSVIPGGFANIVSGDYSFVFGRQAITNSDYTAKFFSIDFPGSLLVEGYASVSSDLAVPQVYTDWIDPLHGDTVYFSAPIKAPNLGAIYDAIVAPAGGDYTTVEAALAAGNKTVFVKAGDYSETQWVLDSTGIRIIGERRGAVTITFSDLSQCIQVKADNIHLENLILKGSGTNETDYLIYCDSGKRNLGVVECDLENIKHTLIYGQNSTIRLNGCKLDGTGGSDWGLFQDFYRNSIVEGCMLNTEPSTGLQNLWSSVSGTISGCRIEGNKLLLTMGGMGEGVVTGCDFRVRTIILGSGNYKGNFVYGNEDPGTDAVVTLQGVSRFIGNSINSSYYAKKILKVEGYGIIVTENYFESGKDIEIAADYVQFCNNNWSGAAVGQQMTISLSTDCTYSQINENIVAGTDFIPQVIDNGTGNNKVNNILIVD